MFHPRFEEIIFRAIRGASTCKSVSNCNTSGEEACLVGTSYTLMKFKKSMEMSRPRVSYMTGLFVNIWKEYSAPENLV